jgi:hypothetical protein
LCKYPSRKQREHGDYSENNSAFHGLTSGMQATLGTEPEGEHCQL